MSTCPNCGNEVPENNKFCMRCGYKIDDAPKASGNLFTAPTSLDGSPSQPGTPPPQDLEQPQQTYNPSQQDYSQSQPDYNQAQQDYYPQQDYNQPQDYYSQQNPYYYGAQTSKKKWVLPAIIGGGAVILIAIAAIFIVLLSQPTDRTPEGAVKLAFQEEIKKGKDYMDDMWEKAPEEYKQYKSEISKVQDYMIDSIEYKITDVQKHGDTATVTVEISIADFDVLGEFDEDPNWNNSKETKQFLSDAFQALKSAGKVTDTIEIDLHKEGNKWELDDPIEMISIF